MKPRTQQHRPTRASQPPATPARAADRSILPLAFSCLVCLSLLVSLLITLPR
ncbi:MAG: hypothetical protein HY910_12845 [Desulfarculus sp.]|nr:hypothetical protein [Desulfarculus sp.]